MSEHEEEPISTGPKVIAKFKSSSTKGGQEAYELTVTDAATVFDREQAVGNAIAGRKAMRDALKDDAKPDAAE